MMKCAFCDKEIDFEDKVSRYDTCPHCGYDLHCCLQCKFYDPGSYNECREVMAERVVDKDRSNFCDYFVLRGTQGSEFGRKATAKQALEDLFQKK
jgi:hypothetical protein